MIRRTSRGALHLLLGGAAAAALVGIAAGIAMTIARSHGSARVPLVGLAIGAVALVVRFLLASPVRAAGAHLARLLLGATVPELGEARDRQGRVDGAVWALIAMTVGGMALLIFLVLVPAGFTLLAEPFVNQSLRVAGRSWQPGGATRWLLMPTGVVLVVLATAVQVGAVALLRRWAVIWLRPTTAEVLEQERARTARLARGNALARDLHDSIGHALTAIGVQAEAGVATAGRDHPQAADTFAQIRDVAHAAVADLDEVLGALRVAQQPERPSPSLLDVRRMAADFPPGTVELSVHGEVSIVDGPTGEAAYRIVQEALTNALRHGRGPAQVVLACEGPAVHLRVTNDVGDPHRGRRRGRGRGLSGLVERADAVGGSIAWEQTGHRWQLVADLPGRSR